MAEDLKKGDEVSWNWGSGQPCTFPFLYSPSLSFLSPSSVHSLLLDPPSCIEANGSS